MQILPSRIRLVRPEEASTKISIGTTIPMKSRDHPKELDHRLQQVLSHRAEAHLFGHPCSIQHSHQTLIHSQWLRDSRTTRLADRLRFAENYVRAPVCRIPGRTTYQTKESRSQDKSSYPFPPWVVRAVQQLNICHL